MADNTLRIVVTASGAEAAARVLQSISAAGGQIGPITAGGARQAEQALTGLGSTARRVFEVFAGVSLAGIFEQGIGAVKNLTLETARLGLEAKVQEDAFARLSKSVGVSGDVLVAQMQKASGGILNTSDVMIAAAKALNQSLQPEQIVNLMTIARQQSKLAGIDVSEAFNQITQAIANQQPRALKQLGIVVDMDAAFTKHAATLSVDVKQLSELGKTQAIYNAVAEQTRHSVAALSDEALNQSEQVQKMAAQWKQAKEDIGKFVVDTGFAVLAWAQNILTSLPKMGDQLTNMAAIWTATGKAAMGALEPVARALADSLVPTLKVAGAAAAAFGVGLTAGFSVLAGPLAFISELIDKLAQGKWPSYERATLLANKATLEAREQLDAAVQGFQALSNGTTGASVATNAMAASTEMGTNKLGALDQQVKAVVPDLKALAAEAEKISGAMRGLTDKLAAESMLPREGEVSGLLTPFIEKLANLDNLVAKDRDRLIEWAKGMVASIVVLKEANAAREREIQLLTEGVADYEGMTRSVNALTLAGGALVLNQREIDRMMAEETDRFAENDLAVTKARGTIIGYTTAIQDLIKSGLTSAHVEATTAQIDAVDKLLQSEFLSDSKRQELLTAKYALESKNRVALFQSEADKRAEILIAETEAHAQALALQNTAAQRQVDVNLALLAEQQRAAGDYFGFLGTQFGLALTKGSDLWAALTTLGQQTYASLTSATSDFFTTFAEELRAGKGLWESFTSAVDSFWKTLMQSMTRAVADFLASQAVKALASFVLGLLGGGGSGSSALGGGLAAILAAIGGGGASGPASFTSTGPSGEGSFNVTSIPAGSLFPPGFWSGLLVKVGDWLTEAGLNAGSMTIAETGANISAFGSSVGSVASALSTLAAAAGVVIGAFQLLSGAAEGSLTPASGAMSGAGLGAGIGTLVAPGLGTVVGALAGALMGAVAGAVQSGALPEWVWAGLTAPNAGHRMGAMLGGPINQDLFKSLGLGELGSTIVTGLVLGPLAPLGFMGKLFGMFSHDETWLPKRLAAMEEANKALATLGPIFQAAARSGSQEQTLAALRMTGGDPTRGPVRADLLMPAGLAQQLGLTIAAEVQAGIVRVDWASLSQAQFTALTEAYRQAPDLLQMITGSGDVALLPQAQAEAVAAQMKAGAIGLIQALINFEDVTRAAENARAAIETAAARAGLPPEVRGAVNALAADLATQVGDALRGPLTGEALNTALQDLASRMELLAQATGVLKAAVQVDQLLPPDLAEQFRAAAAPLYEQVLSALRAGTAEQAKIQIEAFQRATAAWAAFGETIVQATDIHALLPTRLSEQFAAAMKPEYDRLLAVLVEGNTQVIEAEIAQFQKQIQDWAALGTIVRTIENEVAAANKDVAAQIESWQAAHAQMDRAVARAQEALALAVQGGDIAQIAAAAAALHDATMGRLEAERQMVQSIMDAMAATLDQAATLVQMVTAHGSPAAVAALIDALEQMAQTATTAAERLWAVQQGLQAITASLPGLIDRFWQLVSTPSQITDFLVAQSTALLTSLQGLIDAASGGEKLALLQQQAALFVQLAEAAVAAVNQWATLAIEGAQQAAQAELDAIDAQIAAIEETARAEQAARDAEMSDLRDRIQAAREWASALEGMDKFLAALRGGPLAPINPRDQLIAAQDTFSAALAAFMANPTAQGLTDLQAMAQAVLQAAEPIFSKPSPQFQALFALITSQLEAAQALAAQQTEDADVLEEQLNALEELSKIAADAAADQIKALRDQQKTIRDGLAATIAAIRAAAEAEITRINEGLSAAMAANWAEQALLIGEQLANETALLAAVTRGAGKGLIDGVAYLAERQDVAIGILRLILQYASGGAVGPPPPDPIQIIIDDQDTTPHAPVPPFQTFTRPAIPPWSAPSPPASSVPATAASVPLAITLNVTSTVTINGAPGPAREIARAVAAETLAAVRTDARRGQLGSIIREKVKTGG